MNEKQMMDELSVMGNNSAGVLSNGGGAVLSNGGGRISNSSGGVVGLNGATSTGPNMMPPAPTADLGDLDKHRTHAGGVAPPVQGMPPAMGIISDQGGSTVTHHTGDVFTSHEDAIVANHAGR